MKILKIFPCLCILIILSTPIFLNVRAVTNPLSLLLTTDQSIYRLFYSPPSDVTVSGNLTLNGAPVPDGLVAFTVIQGTFQKMVRPVLFRTLTTGVTPNQNWPISDVSVYPVKLSGGGYVPWYTFGRPSSQTNLGPLFNITFRNVGIHTPVYLALSIVDSAQVPVATRVVPFLSLPPNSTVEYITDSVSLGNWVALGNATAYVSFFDNIPPYIYFPLRPESSVQFQVVAGGAATLSTQTVTGAPNNNNLVVASGTFQTTFELNYHMNSGTAYTPWGNYTVRAASSYQGNMAYDSRTFWVRIPGDLNGDGIDDIGDASLIGRYWQQTVPPANPAADADKDGIVDITDAAIVGAYWQMYEQS